jgi:hypothetical protein
MARALLGFLLIGCLLPVLHADSLVTNADDKAGGVPENKLLGLLHDGKLTECTSIGPWAGTTHKLQLSPYPGKNNSAACGVSFSVDPKQGNFLVILIVPPDGSLLYGPILADNGASLFPNAGGGGVQFTPSPDSLKKLKALDSAFASDVLIFAIPLVTSTHELKVGVFFQGIANIMRSPGVLAGAFYVTMPNGATASQINMNDSLDHLASGFSTDLNDDSPDDTTSDSSSVDKNSVVGSLRKLKDEHNQGQISDTNFNRKWTNTLQEVLAVTSTTKEASSIDETVAVDHFQILKDLHDQKLTSDKEYNAQRAEIIRTCFPERSILRDPSLSDQDFDAQQLAKLRDLHDKNLIDDDEYNIKRDGFLRQLFQEVVSATSTTKEASLIDENVVVAGFKTLKGLHDQKLTDDDEYNTQRTELVGKCFPKGSLPNNASLVDKDLAAQQLAKLKDLHDKNLINDDEYNDQRTEFQITGWK